MSRTDLNTSKERRHSGSSESRIPVLSSPSPLRRSGSQRIGGCPPILEQNPSFNRHRSLQSLTTTPLGSRLGSDQDDDLDSLRSYGSCASACSTASQCDHAHFARNGTTYSGRRRRYVVHCSPQTSTGDEYLTPTQRANRTIRKLKSLLSEAHAEIEEKDRQLFRLTKEVVELRLLKVDSGEHVIEPDSSDRLDDSQNEKGALSSNGGGFSPLLVVDLPPSLADSGHFEDLTIGKEWSPRPLRNIEILQRQHEDMIRDLKEKQNDRVDSLLLRITETNDRYYELRPKLEDQQNRIKELEEENENLKRELYVAQAKLEDSNSVNKQLTLHIQSVENKLTEHETQNTNFDKLQADDKRLPSVGKENKEFKCDICNNLRKQENDTKITLHEVLQQNEKLKIENYKLCEVIEELKKKENDIPEAETREEMDKDVNSSSFIIDSGAKYDRITELEMEIENLKQTQKEQEEYQKIVYLEMYKKGQEAARFECSEALNSKKEEKSADVCELLKKLEVTESELENVKAMYKRILETKTKQSDHDPEMTLQFLKSAIYYFLTDKENTQGHLTAIESILGFTENEKINIDKAYLWR